MTALACLALVVVLVLLVRRHAADALVAHHDQLQHQAAELGAVDPLLAEPEEVQP